MLPAWVQSLYCVLVALLLTVPPGAGQTLDALQALLNNFCQSNPSYQGCHNLPPPNPVQGPDGCPVGSRRCHDNQDHCLQVDISCDLIGSRESCSLPPLDGRVALQTLVCGDGSQGVRCDTGGSVPVLSEVVVQCRGDVISATENNLPIASLSLHKTEGVGGGAGVGVYRCLSGGQWQPTYEGSPFLPTLLKSCYYAGCGRLPTPQGDAGSDQTWPWVRHVQDANRNILCTGVLVSNNALLTAAHCVTSSSSSRVPLGPRQRRVSLPHQRVTQTVVASSIHIHPGYSAGLLRENDLAIIKFSSQSGEVYPHACLPPQDIPNTKPDGVIFQFIQSEGFSPWDFSKATFSSNCRSIQAASCSVRPQQGQFCASQANLQLGPGSSGGPYLVNVSPSLDYVWAVLGVYSRDHAASSNCNPNYVYTSTYDHRQWLEDCVLFDNCT